jgi:hypothetical protein
MGRRIGFIVCLFLSVSAGPLRLAEAAGDLARSLAEFDSEQNLEPVDGGVGDEPGDAVIVPACAELAIGIGYWAVPNLGGWTGMPAMIGTWAIAARGVADRRNWPIQCERAQERALWQRFLF